MKIKTRFLSSFLYKIQQKNMKDIMIPEYFVNEQREHEIISNIKSSLFLFSRYLKKVVERTGSKKYKRHFL